ncbi:hypothetical protein Tco_0594733 [Tanacetum coccineum]
MKKGYTGDIVPLLLAMLAGAVVDQAPLPEGNTSGSDKDSLQFRELMVLVPTLVTRINRLEQELKDTKQTLGNAVLKLVKKVKSLETSFKRKSKKVLISESEGEESEDQGRNQDINDDPLVSLKRKAQVQFEARLYTEEDWDTIRAKLEANAELSKDVLGQDLPEQDFAKRMVDMVNQRKKHFAEERAKAKRNKPMTQSQFDDKDVPAEGEKVAEVKEEEKVKRTGKRKKQKARKGINVDKSAQEDSETDKEESVEAMNPTPLTTKSNSVENWKIFQQGQRSVYQIIRANRADTVYISFRAMIKDFTREDLIELYRLVMQKYGKNRPEDAYDRVLWSDLRTMFDPPLIEDAI